MYKVLGRGITQINQSTIKKEKRQQEVGVTVVRKKKN